MQRIKCVVQYDGSTFHGFQRQQQMRTVQGALESVLKKMHKGKEVSIQASGRTDAGVHAVGQVIHFDTLLDIPEANWKKAINTLLPEDVYVKQVEKVTEGFHARYSVSEKEYHYLVDNRREPDVFQRNYAYHFPYPLDMEKIRKACRHLEGTHDFTTFSSAKASVKGSKVRTLYEVSFQQAGDQIEFIFRGSGFLYNMVRILVSLLLDIGTGKREPEEIPFLLEQKDRAAAKKTKTLSPVGLYLWQVTYKEEAENK